MLLDQPEVIDGVRRHRLDRPGARPGRASCRTSTPRSRWSRPPIEAYEDEEAVERQRFLSTAHGGRPQVAARERPRAGAQAPRRRLPRPGRPHRRPPVPRRPRRRAARARGRRRHRALRRAHRPDHRRTASASGSSRARTARSTWSRSTASRTGSAATRAASCARPRPRSWWPRRCRSGDEVEAGAPLLVLESMKMETVLRAPFRGRVRELAVSVGSQVEAGARLLRLEPLGDDDEAAGPAAAAKDVELDLPAEPADVPAAARVARGLQDLRSLLLGFDIDPQDERACSPTTWPRAPSWSRGGEQSWRARSSCCSLFADLARAEPQPARRRGDQGRHPRCTARASTSTPTCRASTPDRAGAVGDLPAAAHPGAGPLRRRRPGPHAGAGGGGLPDLPGPAARVGRRRRGDDPAAAVADRGPARRGGARHRRPGAGAPGRRHPGPVPGRRATWPAASCSRWFAQPMLRRTRAKVYAAVRKHLRHLDQHPDAPDRAERISAMVASARAAGPAGRPADRPRGRGPACRCWRC